MRWSALVAVCIATAGARADDWAPQRDPFDPVVVHRYKTILENDPHDENALNQLVGLYKHHRTLASLEAEYHNELDKGEDWAALVVLARLPRPRAEALALWKRALVQN